MLYREQAAHGQSPSDKRHESRAMILACTRHCAEEMYHLMRNAAVKDVISASLRIQESYFKRFCISLISNSLPQ